MEASYALGDFAHFEKNLNKRSETMSEQILTLQQRVRLEDCATAKK